MVSLGSLSLVLLGPHSDKICPLNYDVRQQPGITLTWNAFVLINEPRSIHQVQPRYDLGHTHSISFVYTGKYKKTIRSNFSEGEKAILKHKYFMVISIIYEVDAGVSELTM